MNYLHGFVMCLDSVAMRLFVTFLHPFQTCNCTFGTTYQYYKGHIKKWKTTGRLRLSQPRNDFLFGHGLIFMTRTAEFNNIFVVSYSFFTSS